MENKSFVFAQFMYNVLDSYVKEDEEVENKIVVETLIPSVKGDYNLVFEIEWDIKDQRWSVSNQDETHYNVRSLSLLDWFNKLSNLKLIESYNIERF